MRSSPLFVAFVGLVAVGIIVALAASSVQPAPQQPALQSSANATALTRPTVAFGNPVRGKPDAKLTIVDFGDFECEACRANELALADLLAKRPDDVRVVWKDFPNATLHKGAVSAAVAARCAAEQGKFWEYHDLAFSTPEALTPAILTSLADSLELNGTAFRACFDTSATKPLVERDFEEGQRLRIDGTPYMFIGERRISGALTAVQLGTIIDAELAKLTEEKK